MPHLKCTRRNLIQIVQISKSGHKICFTTPAKVFKPTKYGGIIIASTHEIRTRKRRKNFNLACKIPEDYKTKSHKCVFSFGCASRRSEQSKRGRKRERERERGKDREGKRQRGERERGSKRD